LSFSYTRPVLYESRPDTYYLSRREFTDGTSSLGNVFSTAWMAWQSSRPTRRMEAVSGVGSVTMIQEGLTKYEGDVVSEGAVTVRTNVAFYPGWRITVDGNSVPVKPDTHGSVIVDIPKGTHRIKVYFSETPLRLTADIVSLLCLVGLVAWGILSLGKSKVCKVKSP
ncbi:hypothetical protein HY032_00395, partial [Candidatus Gottesmanbacteria bacterium]|nr:hypothetical protein [Candidatus Gottesmanbacteria bacterium]